VAFFYCGAFCDMNCGTAHRITAFSCVTASAAWRLLAGIIVPRFQEIPAGTDPVGMGHAPVQNSKGILCILCIVFLPENRPASAQAHASNSISVQTT
jgi:hypothetical protein